MNAMARGKHGNRSIYVPTRSGALKQRSCGTPVLAIVRGMERMVSEMKDRHLWNTLDAIEQKRLTLTKAYPFYASNQLADLEARMSAKDLSASLDGWIQWVRASRDTEARTADVYWQQVTTLVTPSEPFYASDLTKERVMAWLTSREKASPGTRRKYFYALKSFVRYLLDTNVYATDPLAGMKAPKKNRARERWETVATDETIVANALPEYAAFFALIKGVGCDVGSGRRAQKDDINLFAQTINVRGTKTDRRRVHQATIEPWAVPYLKAHLKAMGNADRHTLLFPNLSRTNASGHHRRVCEKLNVKDYTLKDSRHSIGVRMRLAGKTFEEIAAQLGTSVYQTVNVYSRYKAEDAQRAKEAK
jgi:integrase